MASQPIVQLLRGATAAIALTLACYGGVASAEDVKVVLSGNQEIPPATTKASGQATLNVGPDKTVKGRIVISGINPIFAHVHEAPAGKNGPIVFPLKRVSDTEWTVPEGTQLTDAQYQAFKAGNLYLNFHSDEYKGGEIRGQIKP